MRSLTWLKSLCSSESGNVFAIGAAVMPLLIGSAAIGVDSIQLSVWKRQLQRAADSSAIAGAYAHARNDDTHDAVHRDLDKNSFPVLSQEETITVGPRLGFNRTVRVQLTATRTLPFMSIFTGSPASILADATAALVDDGTFCMVSLYDGTDAGIDINGDAEVTLGCGMKTNSIGDQAVTAGGNSSVVSSPIAAVGGIDGSTNNFVQPTTIQPYSAVQEDPLAYLDNPPAQTNCRADPNVQPQNPSVQLTPGCYSGLSVSGLATMAPGTYYITGDIDFGAQANLTGTGVSIVMTGTNGQAGALSINGQATLVLSSGTETDYPGILFYRDRRAPYADVRINGGADSNLTGALYFPTADLTYAGNAGMDVNCLQMVGRILKFRGTANITNICPANSGASDFRQSVVRLID